MDIDSEAVAEADTWLTMIGFVVYVHLTPVDVDWYADKARRCKLYDYERHCWTDFDGRATSVQTSTASRPVASLQSATGK